MLQMLFIHVHVGFYLQQYPAYTFEETLEIIL